MRRETREGMVTVVEGGSRGEEEDAREEIEATSPSRRGQVYALPPPSGPCLLRPPPAAAYGQPP